MHEKKILLGIIHPFLVIGIWVIIWRNIDVYLIRINVFYQLILLAFLFWLLFITDPQYFQETY